MPCRDKCVLCCDKCVLCCQEGTLSAFSQWQAAASNSDLAGFLADTGLVRISLGNISKQQASAAQLAKTIADKTEAGIAMRPFVSQPRLASNTHSFNVAMLAVGPSVWEANSKVSSWWGSLVYTVTRIFPELACHLSVWTQVM